LAPSAVSIAAKKKKKKAVGRNSGTWLVGALKWYFNMDGKLWGIDHACFFFARNRCLFSGFGDVAHLPLV
jgi:hypothetical protein